jgi:hypothetical protein
MASATASTLPASPPRKREGGRSRRGHWNRRRAWSDLIRRCVLLVPSTHHLVALLAGRSDDDLSPVWGTQVNMAAELGCSVSTVRRGLAELEALGLISVVRHPPMMGPGGRFVHRPCNTYVFHVVRRDALAAAEAPRRVSKASYCPVRSRYHLAVSRAASPALAGVVEPPALRSVDPETGEIGQTAHDLAPEVFAERLAAVRAALVRPPGARRGAPA